MDAGGSALALTWARRHAGDRLPALIRVVHSGHDLRAPHAGRAPFLPEPAAIRPDVASGKVIDHFGKHACDPDRELAMAAVEMGAFLLFAARRQPEHLRDIEGCRRFECLPAPPASTRRDKRAAAPRRRARSRRGSARRPCRAARSGI